MLEEGHHRLKFQNIGLGNFPWITSADIYGLNDIRSRKYVTQKGIENSATNLIPKNSIILVTRVSLGRVALTTQRMCFSQDSIGMFNFKNGVYVKFILYYLSKFAASLKYVSRGTTISGVPQKYILEHILNLPPLAEQKRIVNKIESIFAQIDTMKKHQKLILVMLDKLRTSVLKQAFDGKLVPQDPNDESAMVLLEKATRPQCTKNLLLMLVFTFMQWIRILPRKYSSSVRQQ